MNLSDIGKALASIGLPLLGAALPIPGGAALGEALAATIGASSGKPEDILAKLQASAQAVSQAKQFEMTHAETMLKIVTDAEVEQRKQESADIESVNATMRAEAASSANEAWYQKAWRPANGFAVALGSFVGVIAACLLLYQAVETNNQAALAAIPQLATALAAILAIPGTAVGIAAWHRGQMKRELAQK